MKMFSVSLFSFILIFHFSFSNDLVIQANTHIVDNVEMLSTLDFETSTEGI